MTAQALAKRLEVSERTIYRDLEALSTAGVPVYAERGPGGGWALLEGYRTNLTRLTETEARTLFMSGVAGPMADLGLGKALEGAMRSSLANACISTRSAGLASVKPYRTCRLFRMRYGTAIKFILCTAGEMEASACV